MFSSSLRASLVALIVSAIAVSATPSLSIRASAPADEVDGLENLKVTTTITNTGDETLQLLNDPRGVLSSFPEHSFTITDSNGLSPMFNGAKVKYSPSQVISLNEPEDFTVLVPGASLNITHDLSAAYDFTKPGAGEYSIEPSSLFTFVDADGTPQDLYATVEHAADVNLSGNLVASRVDEVEGVEDEVEDEVDDEVDDEGDLSDDTATSEADNEANLARFIRCSWPRRRQINRAASVAQGYSARAYKYLRILRRGTPRYRTWFGTYTRARKNTVKNHFKLIHSRRFSKFTYDCSCRKNVYAYVYPGRPGKIYLCKLFWKAPLTGTDSKAGTLVHESSHFFINGGTRDLAYGHSAAKALARRSPFKAIRNADSHEYFAENTPFLH